jgi:transposase
MTFNFLCLPKAKVMKHLLLIGVDISKKTLDLFFKPCDQYLKISNNPAGFKQFCEALQQYLGAQSQVLVVMEHTGAYSLQWELWLRAHHVGYCKVASLHIKRSLGLTRGKSDRLDSRRIAQFGWRHREELQPDALVSPEVARLRLLVNMRSSVARHHSGYQCRLKEMIHSGALSDKDPLMVLQREAIGFLKQQIKKLDEMIEQLIASDQALSRMAALVQSVKSIGPVICATMIAATAGFSRFKNARKFNCHIGLAPFSYQSGTSIRGRTRVSHLANKQLKALFNLAATNAIQYNAELRQYYEKRLAQGKPPMAVLNIIRSKLVSTIFAVVKRGTPYQALPIAA